MTSKPQITAFIVCCNEEEKIRKALESIKWCDEIVIVVDNSSKDRTLDICKEYTSKIYHRDWAGYVAQKRFALEKCSTEWILNIDADEEVSPDLRDDIKRILDEDHKGLINENGFYISRVVFYLNRWWRNGGWYPEYRLRLCRRSKTTWGGTDPHEKAMVEGKTSRLTGELYHYTYKDISDQINRLNRYSTSSALELFNKGKRATIVSLISRPLARFIKFYILKQGFRDGVAGLVVAVLESYYVFLKYSKLWELRNKK